MSVSISEPGPKTPRRKLPYVNTLPLAFFMRISFLGSFSVATFLTNSLQISWSEARTFHLDGSTSQPKGKKDKQGCCDYPCSNMPFIGF